MIKVLVVDDNIVVRLGTRRLLEAAEDIEVVGEAAGGREAVAQAETLQPDVILMDLRMPDLDGVEATRAILALRPEARIVLTTAYEDDERILAAVKAGAAGYVAKTAPGDGYLRAIRRVHRGETALPINLARQLLRHEKLPAAKELTRREMEILRLVAEGLSNQQIAARIGVGTATVVSHVRNIFAKLGVGNRVEATLYALDQGWTSLERTATARGWRKPGRPGP